MPATLIEAVRALNKFERGRISAIHVKPSGRGYEASISINAYLPLGDTAGLEKPGVAVSGFERWPNAVAQMDWSPLAWAQVLELVRDPEMSKPENCGTMDAVEQTRVYGDGTLGDLERDRYWTVSTHGKARSEERGEWIMRCQP